MKEFLKQGQLEMQHQLPISPNMDPTQSNQLQVQLTFTQVIVQPLFECYLDLFPKTLAIMDLIVDNIRHLGGKQPLYQKRRLTMEEKKKTNLYRLQIDVTRRVSLAAGTIEIPDSIQKYFAKSKHSQRASKPEFFQDDGIREDQEEDGK
jgi:hypothetical protein